MAEPALSTTEAAQQANTTFRQLDWWARNGYVTPSIVDAAGSGSSRRWSHADVDALIAIVRVARDLASLQPVGAMPGELVTRIWEAWHDHPTAAKITIEVGTITVTLDRGSQ